MCIIAIKTKGIELPDEKTLINMWYRNPDGAGFMFAKDGKVHIEKGFMEYQDFRDRLTMLDNMYKLKNLPLIMHFRITTHGGTKPENCHPFPVTDSIGMLKKLIVTTSLGVAHNGIIDIKPREGISDTMEYIATQLAPLHRGVPEFYKNKDLMKMVSNAIESKMAFLTGKGEIYTIGNFVEDNGMKYSNYSYMPYNCRDFASSYWSKDRWEMYGSSVWYSEMPLMWLDERKGEFATTEKGDQVLYGEFAIDKYGSVYEYDYDEEAFTLRKSYRAYNSNFMSLKYDEESDYISKELIVHYS